MFPRAGLALLCLALASKAPAATLTKDLRFSASEGMFGSALPGDLGVSGSFSYGFGTLDYDVDVTSGTVMSTVNSTLSANFADRLSFAEAAATRVTFANAPTAGRTGGAFSSQLEATAKVSARLFGLSSFDLANDSGHVSLSDDNNRVVLAGFGPSGPIFETRPQLAFGEMIGDEGAATLPGNSPSDPDLSLSASVRIEQSAQLTFGNIVGELVATHSSGAQKTVSVSLGASATADLALDRSGEWNLGLKEVTLESTFSSSLTFLIEGVASYAGQSGGLLDSPAIDFANTAPFSLNFGLQNIDLGHITVEPAVSAVPLPAGLPLLLAGLGAFVLMGRHRARKKLTQTA